MEIVGVEKALDERDIQGQASQEIEVEGCNDHIWWGIAQRNPFDHEKSHTINCCFQVILGISLLVLTLSKRQHFFINKPIKLLKKS